MKKLFEETNYYDDYDGGEIRTTLYSFTDPETGVEYLVMQKYAYLPDEDGNDTNDSIAMCPRYNADGTLYNHARK